MISESERAVVTVIVFETEKLAEEVQAAIARNRMNREAAA